MRPVVVLMRCCRGSSFFFNDTATTEIYTLSLHDALPISTSAASRRCSGSRTASAWWSVRPARSEEHTSELQSQSNLVCRLLLEKKKKIARPQKGRAIRFKASVRVESVPFDGATLVTIAKQ